MKKLFIISLLSSAMMAQATFKENLKDVGSQFAEVILVPAHAIKNTIVENEIDQDFVEVVSAYPKFFVEQAQDAKEFTQETVDKIVNSAFVVTVKEAGIKTAEVTQNAATKVKSGIIKVSDSIKDTANQTGQAIKNAAHRTGNAIKTTATTIANSQEVDDIKDVAAQLAAVPFQVAAAVKAALDVI